MKGCGPRGGGRSLATFPGLASLVGLAASVALGLAVPTFAAEPGAPAVQSETGATNVASPQKARAETEPEATTEPGNGPEPEAKTEPGNGPEPEAKTEPGDGPEPEATTEPGDAADLRRNAPPVPFGTRFAEPLEGGERVRLRYQFQRVKSQGLMIGDDDVNPSRVRDGLFIDYQETPRALDVTVHTVEVAWAPHPRTTLVVQVPFLLKDLETLEASGLRRRDETEGLGDVNFALVVPFIRKRHAQAEENSHVHFALDVPSGSIRKEDAAGRRLPYDNQLGNGTVDFEWGWTYRGVFDRFAWGGQVLGRHPLGRNGLRYAEGSRFEGSVWGGVRLLAGISTSVRVQWQKQNNVDGIGDRAFLPITDPAENGKARGGTRFLVGPGLTWDLPGALRGQRIAFEAAIPVHQDLDGPQLEQDWVLTTGWQWAY